MKTKFDFSKITNPNVGERLKYGEYQKFFKKELSRTKADVLERCIVITKYEFADNKKRPLLILGVTKDWKEFIKKETKTNKFFGEGECSITPKKTGTTDLNVVLKRGKVGVSEVEKSFKQYAPTDNIVLTVGEGSIREEEQVDELEQSHINLFTKDLYTQIKEKIEFYKTIASTQYKARLVVLNDTRKMIKEWLELNKSKQSTSINAEREELSKILPQLNKAFVSIRKKYDEEVKFGKGQVVNMDPKDQKINDCSDSLANNRKIGKDLGVQVKFDSKDEKTKRQELMEDEDYGEIKFVENVDFSETIDDAPIVLLAHGRPLREKRYKQVHATHFAKKKPEDIVKFLVKKNLPKHYSGIVYIDGCYTAAGNTPQNYCMKIYNLLVKAGYHYLQVKGNLGSSYTTSNGREMVTFAQVEKEGKKLEQEIKDLEDKMLEYRKEYSKKVQSKVDELEELKNRKDIFEEYMKLTKAKKRENLTKEEQEKIEKAIEQSRYKRLHKQKMDLKNGASTQEVYQNMLKLKEKKQKELNHIKIEELTGTFGPEKVLPNS